MPVYLFTFHAYRSWLPDRSRGFVRRHQGVLPRDEGLAARYRQQANEQPASFAPDRQLLMIDELTIAFEKQSCRGHFIATERGHVHVLVSWRDGRAWGKLRNGLKQSLTRRLNRHLRREHWFSEGASRKRVKDRGHFDFLVNEYLPSHRGWKWREGNTPFL
jgi:hypothetical protein